MNVRRTPMLGVYVHFPYCKKRCPYCDFATFARERIPHEEYADAVLRELEARAGLFAARPLASIYFGGGTPGLWEPASLGRVLRGVAQTFGAAQDLAPLEITCEVNPGETSEAALAELRQQGVNRVSFGVQSLEDRLLVTLGRIHDAAAAGTAVAAARRAGFDNVSIDLMFAVPGQTTADLARTLDRALAMEPDHVSLYNLTIEAQTPYGQMVRDGRLAPPDPELGAEMFDLCDRRLTASGFEHYEVSNYARPGRRARHNCLYWTLDDYLGLGSSAHSFRRLPPGDPPGDPPADPRGDPRGETTTQAIADRAGERFANVRSVDTYLEQHGPGTRRAAPGPDDPTLSVYERRSASDLAGEALWLGLRLADGLDRQEYAERFGRDPLAAKAEEADRLQALGLLTVRADRLMPTTRGLLFSDELAVRLT
jgi:oxygen-independent coproporphyrinogen-3 oxidase